MDFVDNLTQNMALLQSVYDLTAFCYDYLVKNVSDQAVFIGKYILENEQAPAGNPNLQPLRRFDNKIFHALRRQDDDGFSFGKCLAEIITVSAEMKKEIIKYEDDFLNHATLPFFILQAIDRYVLDKRMITDSAPLNKCYMKNSFVYLNIQNNLLDETMEENGFSDMVRNVRIRNCLQYLCIMERSELASEKANPPKVTRLWMEDDNGYRKAALSKKRLKIAVIPLDKEPMVEFPIEEGALFHVEYREGYLERYERRAIQLLELAIDKKANIIVFPEFVCSQEIQKAIQQHLRQMYKKNSNRLKNLLIVLAGSGWTDNNNIAVIFSYDGKLLGKQYKTERFSDLKKKGKELIENFHDPGKETVIVEAEGLGKIAVGICRDICNQGYIKRLTEIFCPQLLLVPAWSGSIYKGFENQLKEITAYNHITCSVLCNCCEAMEGQGFRAEIGMLVTPVKRGSIVEGKACCIQRQEEKCRHCHERGCIILLNMYFKSSNVKQGRMVTQKKQIGTQIADGYL